MTNSSISPSGQSISRLPRHVAVIMDGNGRWAQSVGMPRVFGHQEGAKRVREIVEEARKIGIETLTLYAFSQENWCRPEAEVNALFSLLTDYLESQIDELDEQNIRLSSIGDRHLLPRACVRKLEFSERRTRDNSGMRLVLALSYGGRSDLVNCCKTIAKQVATGEMSWQDISEETLRGNLATWDLPEPDLLIRTSGEERLSNFLLWEIAYTEFVFCKVNWPEFTRQHFLRALDEFGRRQRRFGGIGQSGDLLVEGESQC